jgi:hypothetical protein
MMASLEACDVLLRCAAAAFGSTLAPHADQTILKKLQHLLFAQVRTRTMEALSYDRGNFWPQNTSLVLL